MVRADELSETEDHFDGKYHEYVSKRRQPEGVPEKGQRKPGGRPRGRSKSNPGRSQGAAAKSRGKNGGQGSPAGDSQRAKGTPCVQEGCSCWDFQALLQPGGIRSFFAGPLCEGCSHPQADHRILNEQELLIRETIEKARLHKCQSELPEKEHLGSSKWRSESTPDSDSDIELQEKRKRGWCTCTHFKKSTKTVWDVMKGLSLFEVKERLPFLRCETCAHTVDAHHELSHDPMTSGEQKRGRVFELLEEVQLEKFWEKELLFFDQTTILSLTKTDLRFLPVNPQDLSHPILKNESTTKRYPAGLTKQMRLMGTYPLITSLSQRTSTLAIAISSSIHFFHYPSKRYYSLSLDEYSERYVTSVDWHPLKPLIAIGDSQGYLEIWSVSLFTGLHSPSESDDESLTEEHASESHRISVTRDRATAITKIKFNHTGRLLISGFDDGTCLVYSSNEDLSTLTTELSVSLTFGNILCACWHPEDRYFALGGENDTVSLFSLQKEGRQQTKNPTRVMITPQKTKPITQYFQVTRNEGKLILGEVLTLKNHTSFVSFLAIHPNKKFLVSAGWDGRVNFWKSEFEEIQETLQPVYKFALPESICDAAFVDNLVLTKNKTSVSAIRLPETLVPPSEKIETLVQAPGKIELARVKSTMKRKKKVPGRTREQKKPRLSYPNNQQGSSPEDSKDDDGDTMDDDYDGGGGDDE